MSAPQQINELSKDAIEKLITSIDYVLFDVDGVLVHNRTPTPGGIECIATLRKLGKKIGFVTNNSAYPINVLCANLKPFGATENEIISPNESLLTYLKKIGFKKDIYVIGSSVPKNLLKTAGYNIIEYKDIQSEPIEETISAGLELSHKTLDICKNVGAVLVDYDFNFCVGAAQVAKIILNHMKDVILLGGLIDDTASVGQNMRLITTKFYLDGIERWSKIKAIPMGKPGTALKDVLKTSFNIKDDSRVLFVGDSVETDIAFGVKSGFKTYLVFSGVTSESEAEKWKFSEIARPTYVSQSVNDLYQKIRFL